MNQQENTKLSAELEEELSHLPDEERLELMRTWAVLGKATTAVPGVSGVDEAWNDLRLRIHAPSTTDRARRDRAPRRSSSHRRRGLVVGGVLLVTVVILAWLWQRPVTSVTPAGQLGTVELADGSAIQLNSGSRLTYRPRALPGTAELKRAVQLDGEAFFDVTPAEEPFVVETATALVEVLGTQFNVRARAEIGEDGTEVTLASGLVRVSKRRDLDHSVLLERPGERVHIGSSLDADSNLVSNASTLDYVLAWRSDAFAAIDRPVRSIVAELERRYALNIDVEDGVPVHNSMTLLYGPNTSAERILHDICLVQGCRYRVSTQGFAVFMPASNPNSM